MIGTGRLCEFVDELIVMHNDEHKDKALWDVWLHRVFDKSFADFMEGVEEQGKAAPTQEEVASIIAETQSMLDSFKPME